MTARGAAAGGVGRLSPRSAGRHRRHGNRSAGILPFASLCAVLIGMLAASAPGQHGEVVNLDLRNHSGPPVGAFAIMAEPVTGLYPGAVKPLRLTITNPYRHDIRVTSLAGRLRATSRAGCAPTDTNLVVRPYAGPPRLPLIVPANGRRTAGAIALYMPNTVVDACQRTTFTIEFHGSATGVGRGQ